MATNLPMRNVYAAKSEILPESHRPTGQHWSPSASHQLTLQDHKYGANAQRGVLSL